MTLLELRAAFDALPDDTQKALLEFAFQNFSPSDVPVDQDNWRSNSSVEDRWWIGTHQGMFYGSVIDPLAFVDKPTAETDPDAEAMRTGPEQPWVWSVYWEGICVQAGWAMSKQDGVDKATPHLTKLLDDHKKDLDAFVGRYTESGNTLHVLVAVDGVLDTGNLHSVPEGTDIQALYFDPLSEEFQRSVLMAMNSDSKVVATFSAEGSVELEDDPLPYVEAADNHWTVMYNKDLVEERSTTSFVEVDFSADYWEDRIIDLTKSDL